MLEPMDDNQPRLMESDEDAETSEVADMTRQLSDKITRVGNLKKEMEALQQQVLGESGKVSSAESSQTLSKFTKQLQSKKANIAALEEEAVTLKARLGTQDKTLTKKLRDDMKHMDKKNSEIEAMQNEAATLKARIKSKAAPAKGSKKAASPHGREAKP